ncbi:MAG TPA: DciA family protein [Microbacteriaceae bacterium]|nr:DciA family protein [Microbacteriaceae bacterium]
MAEHRSDSRGADRSAQHAEHRNVFRRLRERFGGRRSPRGIMQPESGSQPFDKGRDPNSIGAAIAGLVAERGWSSALAQSELFIDWADAVGPAVADHAQPAEFVDGQLVIRCDSTAWATQLGLMRSQLLTRLGERFPEAAVERLRFLGPDVPPRKRGPRYVPGRGPRDTYG